MIFGAIVGLIVWFSSKVWIIGDVILVLVLAFFIYRGKKWAMVATMIYWTISKGLQVVSGFSVEDFSAGSTIMIVLWWALFMGFFWRAYQVEKERKRLRNKSGKMKKEIEAENRRLAKPFLNGGKLEEIDKEEREGS